MKDKQKKTWFPRSYGAVQDAVKDKLQEWLEFNPKLAKTIIEKTLQAQRAREAARKSKRINKKKNCS